MSAPAQRRPAAFGATRARPQRAALGLLLLGATLLGEHSLAQGVGTRAQDGRPAVKAPAEESGPPWAALTLRQQQSLAPLKSEWPALNASRKEKWLDVAARMDSMEQAERSRIQQRMAEWVRMSPAERGRARLQFQEARKFAPGNREPQWEAYQALTAEQRRALAEKAAASKSAPAAAAVPPARGSTANSLQSPAGTQVKRNVVPFLPPPAAAKPVAPTVVQTKPGATTSLVTTPERPALHQQAGMPKVNANADFVNPATLLPRRGPQGAAATPARPASAASQ